MTTTICMIGSFGIMMSHLRFSDPTCSNVITDLFHQFRQSFINIIHLISRQHGIQHCPMTHKSISRRFQPKPFSPTLHSIQPYCIMCSRPHTLAYHFLPKGVYSIRVRRNIAGLRPRGQGRCQRVLSVLSIQAHPEHRRERRAAGTSNLNFHKGAYFNTAQG
jgi:hypothetical protein